jgi:preprotein translocase subunit SecF
MRVQGQDVTRAKQEKISVALAKYGGVKSADVSVSDVGPTWGQQVSSKALRALIIFFLVIALYLSVRFTIKMAIAAIVAVIHDIAITIGVYAITGFEVTPATVIAFLTILGFSLYDTVVVFDKIKENEPKIGTVKGMTYTEMANRSLNEVLMRSLNTSFFALLPVASLLIVGVQIYGALALRDFGLALFVGLLTGAYSSIFVATPILAWLKEREPKHRAVAARVETRAQRAAAPVPGRAGARRRSRPPPGRDGHVPTPSPAAAPADAPAITPAASEGPERGQAKPAGRRATMGPR